MKLRGTCRLAPAPKRSKNGRFARDLSKVPRATVARSFVSPASEGTQPAFAGLPDVAQAGADHSDSKKKWRSPLRCLKKRHAAKFPDVRIR
jgi:hypothetical protein